MVKIHRTITHPSGLIRCEVCGSLDIKYMLRDFEKDEHCSKCGKLLAEDVHYFCSSKCLIEWLKE